MISSTFQHIPYVGEKTERHLWAQGCLDWDRYIAHPERYQVPKTCKRTLKAGVLESKARLDTLDHEYFAGRLGKGISWRAFPDFREYACCLDIETTGLFPDTSHVTTVCLHSDCETKTYIRGFNIDELRADLKRYKYLITFNGARFDLPFLSKSMGLSFNQIHLDLLYPLRQLGLRGGLKSIERQLGLSRGSDGVTGFDAVRLWHSYKSGRTIDVAGRRVAGKDSLKLLVEYNRDDTVNLMELAEYTYGMMFEAHKRLVESLRQS